MQIQSEQIDQQNETNKFETQIEEYKQLLTETSENFDKLLREAQTEL